MFNVNLTKTEIAKKAVYMVVAAQAEGVIENQIIERTNYVEDDIVPRVAGFVGGHLVAGAASPYTDRGVDAIVSKYQSWRENRKQKKTETES